MAISREKFVKNIRKEAKKVLLEIWDKYKAEIIATGTDWVYNNSEDLKGKRPKEETQTLVSQVISAYIGVFRDNNRTQLNNFIKYVAEYRGKMGFHISTPLRGFLTLKKGVEPLLAKQLKGSTGRLVYLEIIAMIDELYEETVFKLADYYQVIVEKEIKKQEINLKGRFEELEKFNKLAIGRELKMVELKKENERFKEELKSFRKF